MPPTDTLPRPTDSFRVPTARPARPARLANATSIWLRFLRHSLAIQLRRWQFLVFIIAMPVVLFLFYASVYGDQPIANGVTVAGAMMGTMAAYGGLGAAMMTGNSITEESRTGWLRQLRLTALSPVAYLGVRLVVAVLVMVPAIGAVYVAGYARGVRLDAGIWAASFGLLLLALLPMIVLGMVIGLWVSPQASQPATTAGMLVLAMLGGLWFPLSMMPDWMQPIGRALPSHWAGEFAMWPMFGGDFAWRGVGVLATWTIVLCALGVLGYRRSVRNR